MTPAEIGRALARMDNERDAERRRYERQEQAAMERVRRPITPDEVEQAPEQLAARQSGRLAVSELLDRWNDLDGHFHHARAVATLKARGTYDPVLHGGDEAPPFTADEHLTLIALGEAIARTVHHPAQVHHALQAGATWEQIAAAAGQDEQEARQAYRDWADGQWRLHEAYGKWGMTAEEHAAAVARAAD